MPLKSAAQFALLSSALGGEILKHTNRFAQERGLPPMRAAGLDQMSTKLDDIAAELLMFGHDTWPDSAGPEEAEVTHEAAPSDVDPPTNALAFTLCAMAAVLVSVPATMFLHAILDFPLPGIFYVLTAVTTALIFGSTHGLIVTACNAIAHNLVVEPPALDFTMPNQSELYLAACCITLVLATPWIARRAAKWRHRLGTMSPNRLLALK
jgi:K+-sensing histidine kinase KdpD